MNNSQFSSLPPELQQRIVDIIGGAQPQTKQEEAPAPQPAPPVRPPSLMDHTIALRQEVAQMSQQLVAMGKVVEAVGVATGELYQLFQSQTATSDYGAAYQTQQPQPELENDY